MAGQFRTREENILAKNYFNQEVNYRLPILAEAAHYNLHESALEGKLSIHCVVVFSILIGPLNAKPQRERL